MNTGGLTRRVYHSLYTHRRARSKSCVSCFGTRNKIIEIASPVKARPVPIEPFVPWVPDWPDWKMEPDWTDWVLADAPGHDGVYVQVDFPLIHLMVGIVFSWGLDLSTCSDSSSLVRSRKKADTIV